MTLSFGQSDSTGLEQAPTATRNNIFDIPSHPGRPEEYNIDEPAPLIIRKVFKAQNTSETPLAPAAVHVALKVKYPIEAVLQEFEESVALEEELVDIEAKVAGLDLRVEAVKSLSPATRDRKRPGNSNVMDAMPDNTPATRHSRKEKAAKLQRREYIPPLKITTAEERAKVKRQAVYESTVPPGCLEGGRVQHHAPFGDINEEINYRLKEAKNSAGKDKGKGRAVWEDIDPEMHN